MQVLVVRFKSGRELLFGDSGATEAGLLLGKKIEIEDICCEYNDEVLNKFFQNIDTRNF